MRAGGQTPSALAAMLFSSRECCKSQGGCPLAPGWAGGGLQAAGQPGSPRAGSGYPAHTLPTPALSAGIHLHWDNPSLVPPAVLRSSFSWMSRLGDLSEHRLTTSSLKVFLETPAFAGRQRKGSNRQGWAPAAPSCERPAGSGEAQYIDDHQR